MKHQILPVLIVYLFLGPLALRGQCNQLFTTTPVQVQEFCNSGNYTYTIEVVENLQGQIGIVNLYDLSTNDTLWANTNCGDTSFVFLQGQPLSGYNGVALANGSGTWDYGNGRIFVQYMVADATQSTDNCTFHYSSMAVSTQEAAFDALEVYPNPAMNELRLRFQGEANLKVRAMDGKNMHIQAERDAFGYLLDIHLLAAGTYILQVEDAIGLRSHSFVKR